MRRWGTWHSRLTAISSPPVAGTEPLASRNLPRARFCGGCPFSFRGLHAGQQELVTGDWTHENFSWNLTTFKEATFGSNPGRILWMGLSRDGKRLVTQDFLTSSVCGMLFTSCHP